MSQVESNSVNELLESFEELESWEDRCDHLIDLGLDLPDLPAEAKTEANRVHGCQSNVWMTYRISESTPPTIDFAAESDGMLVSGLIAILLAVYSGKTSDEILATDIKSIFHRIGLDRHLSPQRRNGLNGMVQRVREIARKHA